MEGPAKGVGWLYAIKQQKAESLPTGLTKEGGKRCNVPVDEEDGSNDGSALVVSRRVACWSCRGLDGSRKEECG